MDQVPPGGYPLLEAFRALLPEARHRMLAALMLSKSLQGPGEAAEVTRLRGILWAELSSRLQAGALAAKGFSHGATIPTPIHPAFFNNAVPNYTKDDVAMNGATYAGVRVFSVNTTPGTQDLVSPGAGPEPETINPPPQSVSIRKGIGGAPPTYPWAEFVREVVRFANSDGFATRRELSNHMREWVESHWKVQPDAETLRRKLVELCPLEIPQN
jgi:hypothetical protein